jgi:heme-degrading monooxygenase HmoA
MFARIGRLRFRPGHRAEVVRIAQESLPTVRALPGFVRMTYLYDDASGWGVAVSLWATAEDADASDARLASVAEQFAAYGAGDLDDEQAHAVSGRLPTLEVIADA